MANTSHHLRTLARAGLLTSRRDGTAEQGAGVEKLARAYLGDRSELEAIGHRELLERMRTGSVVVLDVRPAIEYDAGRIAGARSMPLAELLQRVHTLPTETDIVAYCRGPYCVYADDAVRLLRREGFRASRLVNGFPEWKQAGLPTDVDGVDLAAAGPSSRPR